MIITEEKAGAESVPFLHPAVDMAKINVDPESLVQVQRHMATAALQQVQRTVSALPDAELAVIYTAAVNEVKKRETIPPAALAAVLAAMPRDNPVTLSAPIASRDNPRTGAAWETRALEIQRLEGFRVRFLDVEPGQTGFEAYNYLRKTKGAMTVRAWRERRFAGLYAPYTCQVLMADGGKALDFLSLAEVRQSYERAGRKAAVAQQSSA